MVHYKLYKFKECAEGRHDKCLLETLTETCICGCHAEMIEILL